MIAASLSVCTLSWAAAALPPAADVALEVIGRPVPEAVAEFQLWDAGEHDGRGRSDATKSGGLAWGESSFLANYMRCYRATRDPYWLDRVVDHFTRMLAAQTDRNGVGFLAWDDTDYSVGIVKVAGAENADGLTLTPELQREYVTRRGGNVTGHRYRIRFATADRVSVQDETAGRVVLAETAYADGLVLDLFAGQALAPGSPAVRDATAPLTLSGAGRAGATFLVETTAAEWIEYVVHDGMVTFPIAWFIEEVSADRALHPRYKPTADRWLAWFHQHVYTKWERFWVQVDAEAGAYRFTDSVTERFPGYLLPHNQYLALGRAYLILQAVDGVPHRDLYRVRAAAMARYFQRHLRLARDGSAYVWNYWDPLPGQSLPGRSIEDDGHGTIDAGFAVDAARHGLVFTSEDATRFARTFTDVMGNGDLEHPAVAKRVDGSGGFKSSTWQEWVTTGLYDERALRFGGRLAAASPLGWPTLCDLAAALGAVTAADRRQAAENSGSLRDQLALAPTGNYGFEAGLANRPLGWACALWSKEGKGRFEWSTDACEGKHSLALIGEPGPAPNLIAERAIDLDGPTVLTITLKYKTSGEPGARLSLIADVPGAERQYDNSPGFAPSETWQPATWTVTTRPGATRARLVLRNAGVGTVWYDDVRLERAPAKER